MKMIDRTLKERIKASANTNASDDDDEEPFLSPTFKSSIQVYSENNSPIEEHLDIANDANNENGMILYNNVEEEENAKEIAEDEALQTITKDSPMDQNAYEKSINSVREMPEEVVEEIDNLKVPAK